MLKEVDPESTVKIHEENIKRVIRALEYHHLTGRKISEHNLEESARKPVYNAAYFVLTDKRELMYERIDKRVDKMIDEGLEDEVKRLLDMGYNEKNVSMQGIGYKEMVSYIRGDISLEEAIELIKKNTRNKL